MSQSSPARSPAERGSTEWAMFSGGAADLPGGVRGGQFWAMQLRWGKVLTAPHGPGPLRGTLEYAFELVPAMVLQQACTDYPVKLFINLKPGIIPAVPFECANTTPFLAGLGSDSTPSNRGGTLFGGGINPFFWQYNFTSHQRLVPYINLGGGMLFTTRDFPAGTSSFNFTPQGGIGAYWLARPNRAVSFGVRYHHISNAGITKPNPGHNALYFYGGLSWWR